MLNEQVTQWPTYISESSKSEIREPRINEVGGKLKALMNLKYKTICFLVLIPLTVIVILKKTQLEYHWP